MRHATKRGRTGDELVRPLVFGVGGCAQRFDDGEVEERALGRLDAQHGVDGVDAADRSEGANGGDPHQEIELPRKVEEQCRLLVSELGLRFGAIDLVRTVDDQYYFLEINPNGEWLWIEDALGYPIAASIASQLLG